MCRIIAEGMEFGENKPPSIITHMENTQLVSRKLLEDDNYRAKGFEENLLKLTDRALDL